MKKTAIILTTFIYQIPILYISFYFFALFFILKGKKDKLRRVVIGVEETARNIYLLGNVFPSVYTVNLSNHPFYQDGFNFTINNIFNRVLLGPILLAYITHLANTFVYIGSSGFLVKREYDFRFLKSKGKILVNYFCGSEIRSLVKTKEFYENRDEDSYVNYLQQTYDTDYDNIRKKIAYEADKYADLIFNWKIDQLSYITRKTYSWPYIIDLKEIDYNFSAPESLHDIIILHAPSNPFIKGTPLVSAAIKKLKKDGYNFKYIELNKVPYKELINYLNKSQIVLNEFYLATPGSFGIEAMAAGNALLTSADRTIEKDLPEGCEHAWIVTHYWEIYDNLKLLLDHPELIEKYAISGRKFVERHYTIEKAREYYKKIFSEHNIPM